MTLYEELGVDKTATPEQVKKAFRQKAKKTHPDKGGNVEEFKTISLAYSILSDEEKRKQYDEGRDPKNINQPGGDEQQALQIVLSIFNSTIEDMDPERHNVFEIIRQTILSGFKDAGEIKKRNSKAIARYELILKRIKKSDKTELFIQVIRHKIEDRRKHSITIDTSIKQGKDALKLIEGCEYITDLQQRFGASTTSSCDWGS